MQVKYVKLSVGNRLLRGLWTVVNLLLYRPTPNVLHAWRRLLLRIFGARIESGAHPYPSARIWAPWNLIMREHSCLGHYVDCYSVDKIELGAYATVSQYSFLCTASHDHLRRDMPLISAPIHIGSHAWVSADVFVGPGVTIGEGAVIGARSTVVRDVGEWIVAAGSPLKIIRRREMRED